MNTRKIGDKLENFVLNALNFKKTRGSGSVLHDGDLKDKDIFVIECKRRNTDGLSIERKWIENVKKQAELSDREWALVNQLKDGSIYVTINFNIFTEMYNALKNNK